MHVRWLKYVSNWIRLAYKGTWQLETWNGQHTVNVQNVFSRLGLVHPSINPSIYFVVIIIHPSMYLSVIHPSFHTSSHPWMYTHRLAKMTLMLVKKLVKKRRFNNNNNVFFSLRKYSMSPDIFLNLTLRLTPQPRHFINEKTWYGITHQSNQHLSRRKKQNHFHGNILFTKPSFIVQQPTVLKHLALLQQVFHLLS